jgi:anti-sigma factor RsiW
MTDPASSDRTLRLNAALDGELDPMSSLELEREMGADPALAAERERLRALREAILRHAPRDAAPQALVDKIAALAAPVGLALPPQEAAPVDAGARNRPAHWFNPRALALAASLAVLGFAAGAGLTSLRTQSASHGVAENLVSDFSRAAIVGQPYDVASSDRHTVKPWLAGRTTVSASIVDLSQQGFALAGARVAVVDRIPAPTLVYRHGEHLIAVTELPLDASGARAAGAIETIDGYHVARWSDANLGYIAVSDMDEETLADFVAAFRKAQKPEEAR